MSLIVELDHTNWQFAPLTSNKSIQAIENGQVLFLPKLNFELLDTEKNLLSPQFATNSAKNISYRIDTNSLAGFTGDQSTANLLKIMLNRYANSATTLVHSLFPHYKDYLIIARTSYRPLEIVGRQTSYRKDDKRLHVDAFPATPNQGNRLLRVFCNVNPEGKSRVWRIGEPFVEVAEQFIPKLSQPKPILAALMHRFKMTKTLRSNYDHYMLQLHDHMKADLDYQAKAQQITFSFPALSSWVVYTDQVSHAAMSGQYLLEQTFYLPVAGMLNPETSPLKTLERLLQQRLAA